MNEYEEIAKGMPMWLRDALLSADKEIIGAATEIRIRKDQPISISIARGRKPHLLGRALSQEEIRQVLNHISGYSIYLRTQELRKGYMTLKGGHRMAVCGRKAEETSGGVADVTSLCIRIAREIQGCGSVVAEQLSGTSKGVLVLGGPGSGKTTVIRDAARIIAAQQRSVVIVDEKNELAPPLMRSGGIAADVLSDYPKAEAIRMAVRLLSPDCIIMDELCGQEELMAMEEALASGIKIVASAHGRSIYSLDPAIKRAADQLARVAVLKGKHDPGAVSGLVSV